jgi:hypothetical protein
MRLPTLGRRANIRCGSYQLFVSSAARSNPISFGSLGINETDSTTRFCLAWVAVGDRTACLGLLQDIFCRRRFSFVLRRI